MNWQGLIVAVVVCLAAVSLYRHVRGLMIDATPGSGSGSQPLCHGCRDCVEPTTHTNQISSSQDVPHTPLTH
jgi:hypothetical protein